MLIYKDDSNYSLVQSPFMSNPLTVPSLRGKLSFPNLRLQKITAATQDLPSYQGVKRRKNEIAIDFLIRSYIGDFFFFYVNLLHLAKFFKRRRSTEKMSAKTMNNGNFLKN